MSSVENNLRKNLKEMCAIITNGIAHTPATTPAANPTANSASAAPPSGALTGSSPPSYERGDFPKLNEYIADTPSNGEYWFEWALYRLFHSHDHAKWGSGSTNPSDSTTIASAVKNIIDPTTQLLLTVGVTDAKATDHIKKISTNISDAAAHKVWSIMKEANQFTPPTKKSLFGSTPAPTTVGAQRRLKKIIEALSGATNPPPITANKMGGSKEGIVIGGSKRINKSRKARKFRRSRRSRRSRKSRKSIMKV